MLNVTRDHVACTSLCPVGAGEHIGNGIHIQPSWVGADGKLISVSFNYLRHGVSVS